MKEEMPSIETSGLRVGYRMGKADITVLRNIDLELRPGRLIAMIGENGIGKSTLLRSLSGLQPALSGQIALNRKPLSSYNISETAKLISIVLTDKLPAGNLTVYELVALGRQPYTNWLGTLSDVDREAIDRAIAQTNIWDLIDRKHYEISDGQLQKVMIARAIAQDTPVIILDEPTTHLDLVHKLKLLDLLRKLAHIHNKCVLFSTHDIELALNYCDEMIVVTKDGINHGDLNTLVDDGVLGRLFSESAISFDAVTGRFHLKDR